MNKMHYLINDKESVMIIILQYVHMVPYTRGIEKYILSDWVSARLIKFSEVIDYCYKDNPKKVKLYFDKLLHTKQKALDPDSVKTIPKYNHKKVNLIEINYNTFTMYYAISMGKDFNGK